MNLPKEIKIGNDIYKIELVDKSQVGDGDSASYGGGNGYGIMLDESLSEEETMKALFYEITQVLIGKAICIADINGLDNDVLDELTNEVEEVELMGSMIAELIKDNDFSFMKLS